MVERQPLQANVDKFRIVNIGSDHGIEARQYDAENRLVEQALLSAVVGNRSVERTEIANLAIKWPPSWLPKLSFLAAAVVPFLTAISSSRSTRRSV